MVLRRAVSGEFYEFICGIIDIDKSETLEVSMADESGEKPRSLHEDNDEAKKQKTDELKSQVSTNSTRYLKLKNRKKTAKTRLTKTRNQIAMLTTEYPSTKTEIRRAIRKMKSESEILEKIIHALKETVVLSDETLETTNVDTVVENLDKELSDILDSVDASVKAAEDHIRERLLNGENESVASAVSSSKLSVDSLSQCCPPKSYEEALPELEHETPNNVAHPSQAMESPQNHSNGPPQVPPQGKK